MFSIEEIIQETIKGTLTFDRAFIRSRRGSKHPIKKWRDFPSSPARCTPYNRELGWKSAIQTLIHQFELIDVYTQDADHIPLPPSLHRCEHIDEATPGRSLLILAKNLPIPVPRDGVAAIVLLLEEPETNPAFETILIAKSLDGVSSPIFQPYLQDYYLIHPWQKAVSNDGMIEMWDLINGLDFLRVQTLWKGTTDASKWIRLVGHIGDPTHTPPRKNLPSTKPTYTPIPPYPDLTCGHLPQVDILGNKSKNSSLVERAPECSLNIPNNPSVVLQRVQKLCDALRFIPPEKYNTTLHTHMHSQVLSPFVQHIFELKHPTVREEPQYQGTMLVIAPEEPFTYLFGLVCTYILQGWHVALYPSGKNAQACTFLAQIAFQYQLPISLQTRFPKVSRIVACDPLPEEMQWMYGDPRLEILGRRFSMAWCSQKDFRSLAWALRFYEGTGIFAPAGVFCPKDIDLNSLRDELRSMSGMLPYNSPDPIEKKLIEERIAIAKQYGHCFEEEGIVVLPPDLFLPYPCPQIVTLYPVENAQEAFDILLPYRGWLKLLGSDDVQYPHPELNPNPNLLSLQLLFQGVLPIAMSAHPPLSLWLDS